MTLLVTWLWQGAAIAGAAAALMRLVSPLAAAMRHRLWWLAQGAVLAVPILQLAPALVPVGPASLSAGAPAASLAARDASGAVVLLQLDALPTWLLPLVAWTWLGLSVIGLLRLAVAWHRMRGIVARSLPVEGPMDRLRGIPGTTVLLSRRPLLRVSGEVRGACAVGFRRPVILVSTGLLRELDDAQLHQVLLHECAHLARRDDWTRLLLRMIAAVAWVHPAVHWIAGRIDDEMEAACDQRVVAASGNPTGYARVLLDVAGFAARHQGTTLTLAPGSSARMPLMRSRIERLAAAADGQQGRGAGVAALGVSAALVGLAAGGATLPALAAFGGLLIPPLPDSVPSTEQIARFVAVEPAARRASEKVVAGRFGARIAAPRDAGAAAANRASSTAVVEPAQPQPQGGTPGALPDGRETARPSTATPAVPSSQGDALLHGRPLTVTWRVAPGGRSAESRTLGGNAASDAADGMTRAALSTAGAFTRFGYAVASRF